MGLDQGIGCTKLTDDPPIFFVCGTPSDRHGFEYKALDGRRLPPRLANYVDAIPKEKFPERGEATHIFVRIGEGELDGAIYAESRWIHPNDTEHNRGAYIAAGCWVEAPFSPTRAIEALHRIEDIHDDLAAHRGRGAEAFPPGFRLHAYTAPEPSGARRGQLAGLLYLAATGTGPWEGKTGALVRTSEEIGQGSLAAYCIHERTMAQAPIQPVRPEDRSWQTRLHDVMQEAMSESPRTRQLLGELSRLEEQRISTVKTLFRAVQEAPRRPGARGGRSSSGPHGAAGRGLTAREIGLSAAGLVLGIAVALAVVVAVWWLSP